MDLVTPEEKLEWGNVFNDIHDTFARPIYIWKNEKRVIVSEDPSYSFAFGDDQPAVNATFTPQSGQFMGRILWNDPTKTANFYVSDSSPDIRTPINANLCRIKLKQDAIEFMKGYKEIEIDGRFGVIEGTSRPHGLFKIDFWSVWVKESK